MNSVLCLFCSLSSDVKICLSSLHQLTSGVPQGTVLGPLLFLFVHLYDIASDIRSEICLFADDFILYRTIKKLQRLSHHTGRH